MISVQINQVMSRQIWYLADNCGRMLSLWLSLVRWDLQESSYRVVCVFQFQHWLVQEKLLLHSGFLYILI